MPQVFTSVFKTSLLKLALSLAVLFALCTGIFHHVNAAADIDHNSTHCQACLAFEGLGLTFVAALIALVTVSKKQWKSPLISLGILSLGIVRFSFRSHLDPPYSI